MVAQAVIVVIVVAVALCALLVAHLVCAKQQRRRGKGVGGSDSDVEHGAPNSRSGAGSGGNRSDTRNEQRRTTAPSNRRPSRKAVSPLETTMVNPTFSSQGAPGQEMRVKGFARQDSSL